MARMDEAGEQMACITFPLGHTQGMNTEASSGRGGLMAAWPHSPRPACQGWTDWSVAHVR